MGAPVDIGTGSPLYDTYIRDSIAAGCPYVGFAAPSYTCDDTDDDKFKNNVAHSVNGCGAHIYPDPGNSKSAKCMEGSHFSAYKV